MGKNKTVHKYILTEKLQTYNTSVRKVYFSSLINTSIHNNRLLFSTIDSLLNPPFSLISEFPGSKCEELAGYFREKIINIRSDICQQNKHNPLVPTSFLPCDDKHNHFKLVDVEESINRTENLHLLL